MASPPTATTPGPFLRSGSMAKSAPGVNTVQVTSATDTGSIGVTNLLTNTTGFNNGTFWSSAASVGTWTLAPTLVTGNTVTGTFAATSTNQTPVAGTTYQITFRCTVTAGSFVPSIGDTSGPTISVSGDYRFILTATDATPLTFTATGFAGTIISAITLRPQVRLATPSTPNDRVLDSTGAIAFERRNFLASMDSFADGANSMPYGTTAAQQNVALGTNTLSNATGSATGCVAIGFNAMQYNYSGSASVAIGFNAAQFGQIGGTFVAIGGGALQVCQDSTNQNTAIGGLTLQSLTSGKFNLALGFNAGQTLITGTSNILIGANIQTPTTNTSNYLSIGDVLIGNTSAKTGYINKSITTVAGASYTAASTDELILCTATTTITLSPTPSGKTWIVKNANTAAITITIQLSSGNIDGSATQTITTTNGLLQVTVDGTNGWITGKI